MTMMTTMMMISTCADHAFVVRACAHKGSALRTQRLSIKVGQAFQPDEQSGWKA
jgi:hypothetical protein